MDKLNIEKNVKSDVESSTQIWLDKEKIESRIAYHFVKRITDIIGSLVGLFFLSPIFLYVAIKIKYEEPAGPIFFVQERVGKNGQLFKMFKFRSMCVDAEKKLEELLMHNEIDGAMFKMKDDPRVTKIGRFIRKTSIDELPQFWNVLKGDMSLVGPRPPLVREVRQYNDYDMQRLLVKPGCTGLWQVSGRNHVGFDEMVKLDLIYIRSQTNLLDLKLMCKTFFVILQSDGAY